MEKSQLTPTLRRHQARIQAALSNSYESSLAVTDTCRLDNGGILRLPNEEVKSTSGCVAFVLAAGAATRYNAPYGQLMIEVQQNPNQAALLIEKFFKKYGDCAIGDLKALDQTLSAPKAFHPCTRDGMSFLEAKFLEHTALGNLQGQIYVTPAKYAKPFADFAQKFASPPEPVYLEQDLSLNTIRFDHDGQPWMPDGKEFSYVGGGHGLLVKLFSETKRYFPEANSLLIRNIDNVQGNHPEAVSALSSLVNMHDYLLSNIQEIRQALLKQDLATAELNAKLFVEFIARSNPTYLSLATSPSHEFHYLYALLEGVFHTPARLLAKEGAFKRLNLLFNRPFNILGQVPNTSKDVGGVPCFIEFHGEKVKVCLENSHISAADRQKFLSTNVEKTFFNPVCIAAEIPERHAYESDSHPFWIVANKQHQGQTLFHHEELLSELVGNSILANCLFVALPRSTFNPHKAIEDTRGKTNRNWFLPKSTISLAKTP